MTHIPIEFLVNDRFQSTTQWIPSIAPSESYPVQVQWSVPTTYMSSNTIHKKAELQLIVDYTYFILASILILIIPLGFFYKQYYIYNKAITIDCKLLNCSFKGLTLETNTVPVVGMGMNGGATVGV